MRKQSIPRPPHEPRPQATPSFSMLHSEKREGLAPGKRSHVECNSGGTVIIMRGRPGMIANRAIRSKCTVLAIVHSAGYSALQVKL